MKDKDVLWSSPLKMINESEIWITRQLLDDQHLIFVSSSQKIGTSLPMLIVMDMILIIVINFFTVS